MQVGALQEQAGQLTEKLGRRRGKRRCSRAGEPGALAAAGARPRGGAVAVQAAPGSSRGHTVYSTTQSTRCLDAIASASVLMDMQLAVASASALVLDILSAALFTRADAHSCALLPSV